MSLRSTLRAVTSCPRVEEAPSSGKPKVIDVEKVRFPGEDEAAERLRRCKGFRRTLKEIALRRTLRSPRRRRLEDSVLLDEKAAPELFAALAEVRKILQFPWEIEVFQGLGEINAAMSDGAQRAILTLEGPVLEILTGKELRGLLGHELAHYLCHSGPEARLREETQVALAWQGQYELDEEERAQAIAASSLLVAQEITSDRFELLASRSLEAYLRTSLKFSTELHDRVLHHEPRLLLRQAREALDDGVGDRDRRASHPERYIRVRAAELFAGSDLFRRLTGEGAGKRSLASVNEEILRLLAGWVPRGADRIDQARFERFLLATAAAIVSADGVFNKEERRYLSRALPLSWRGKLPAEKEADSLMEEFSRELRASGDQRALVTTLNFLCGVVEADGRAEDEELRAIDEVGRSLGARELFRHELKERFDYDPRGGRSSRKQAAQNAVLDADPRLLRYLDTVVLAGQRRTTAGRLLSLGGYPDASGKSLENLAVILDASGLVVSPAPVGWKRTTAVVLRREDPG
jgi:tellurite resistance protein